MPDLGQIEVPPEHEFYTLRPGQLRFHLTVERGPGDIASVYGFVSEKHLADNAALLRMWTEPVISSIRATLRQNAAKRAAKKAE